MKENIIKVGILSIFLITISSLVILFMGKTYTMKFPSNTNYKIELNNESGEIEILKETNTENNFIIKVKSKKPGRVILNIMNKQYTEAKVLYIHKSMIITDNTYFGDSTGSEIIPISLFIILAYTLYLLIKEYKNSIKNNLYQYKNIAYLGIIIFLCIFTFNIFKSIFNYHGLYETVYDIINSSSVVSIYLLPIALITFTFVTFSNINLIRKEGLSFRNLLGLLFGIFICISTFFPELLYRFLMQSQKINIYNLNGPGPYIYSFIETLIYLSISYLECILIGTIIIALKAVKRKVAYNKDYLIILGCKIKEDGSLTPLLKGRVDKALEFRNNQLKETGKDLIFIPSGGKGNDEIISEAEAIKNYLLEKGIKEKNIIIENKSKNTYENIKYSNKLISKKKANICFSTTNYHVLRTGLLATSQGLKIDGIGSKTKSYFWINAFIREFIGTIYSEKKKHITVFSMINIILIIMIIITFIANNI